ncbi:MAG: hypothetical protein QW356_08815 [Candidatus Hadarchaeales archaeon]
MPAISHIERIQDSKLSPPFPAALTKPWASFKFGLAEQLIDKVLRKFLAYQVG